MRKSYYFQIDKRDETIGPLNNALQKAELGEVEGSGYGGRMYIVGVKVNEFNEGLMIIRHVLRELNVASTTRINFFSEVESEKTFRVYD